MFKLMFPLVVIFVAHAGAKAQSYTPEEQDCFGLVQGKVAYDKLGNKTWNEGNIRNLCRGTTNPDATISCFRDKIAEGITWDNAIPACAASALKPNFIGLAGNWSMFDANGLPYEKYAVITQTGANVTLDNGYGSVTTGDLESNKLNARAWKLTGTISADGSRIDWSNGLHWEKRLFARTEVPRAEEDTKPVDNRTLTLRNTGAINVTLNLYKADRKVYDNTPVKSIKWVDGGSSPNVSFGGGLDPATPLEVEITMKVGGLGAFWDLLIYRATIAANSSNLCFEVGGTAYRPTAAPCANTKAVEADHLLFKNEAGFAAFMNLDYTQFTSDTDVVPKAIRTDDTILGMERKLYRPRDAADREMTLKVKGIAITDDVLQTVQFKEGQKFSGCYKVWGNSAQPKISPCLFTGYSRSVKFWNNSGVNAYIRVTYDAGKNYNSNVLEFTQTESVGIPNASWSLPIRIDFIVGNIDGSGKQVGTMNAPSNFTGELCYKIEGALNSPVVSTCDDIVGDNFGETRMIRFQNEAGYDAQMVVSFFVDEVINGQTIAMPKFVMTGSITGLGGKFRLAAIPKKTSKGIPITIAFQGSTTLRNDIWSTTLPGDFTDSPQPCFKVWGTLFDPQAGKCGP